MMRLWPLSKLLRGVSVLLLMGAMTAWAAGPAPHQRKEVHKEIEALETEWRNAQLSNDWKTMDRLLDDEYTGISTNGLIQTKEQAIAARKAGTLVIKKLQFSDVKVRILNSQTALVTSNADLVGTNGGDDISGHYIYQRIYTKKLGSDWRISSFIATRKGEPLLK